MAFMAVLAALQRLAPHGWVHSTADASHLAISDKKQQNCEQQQAHSLFHVSLLILCVAASQAPKDAPPDVWLQLKMCCEVAQIVG